MHCHPVWSTDCLDIRAARILLDNDHYAMEKLKKRVLEYLAVRQLKNNLKGPILCFVGPPGVGKTSVGRSIAKTLGREFHRIALGGVCDQSDIRGHRWVSFKDELQTADEASSCFLPAPRFFILMCVGFPGNE